MPKTVNWAERRMEYFMEHFISESMVEAAAAFLKVRDNSGPPGSDEHTAFWDAHTRLYDAVHVPLPNYDDLFIAAQKVAERRLTDDKA